ncbi:MAG TPA: LamG-like jellyroll fold domain-containing protein [Armatimonadota bacterium]|jgi:hypothetical protein
MRQFQSTTLRLVSAMAILSLAQLTAWAVPFAVTYTNAANVGFNDPVLGPARRAAFQAALLNWGGKLEGNVPITVNASMDSLGGTATSAILGQAHTNYVVQLNSPPAGYYSGTWYTGSLISELVGSDIAPGTPMIIAQFNSDVDNSTVLGSENWYYGTDGNAGSNVDFYEVVLHELCHGLGFFSQIQSDGSYQNAAPNNLPSIYDQFLATGQGLASDRLVVLTQAQRAAALLSGSLYFDGNNARAANGGPNARIYAPTTYQLGSSTSHLDQATYQNGPNALMCPVYSIDIHEAGPVGYAVLKDMGWPFTTNQPPAAANSSASVLYNTPTSITMSASDSENDPLTYQVLSGPSHGVLSAGTGAQRTYTPAAGYTGTDSFTFRVNDGHWDSNVATVSIAVLPPAPVITSFTPTSGPVGTAVTITGQNFGSLIAFVNFNGVQALVTQLSDPQITCTVPAGATTGKITVTASGGSTTSANDFIVSGPATGSTTYATSVTDTSATLHANINPSSQSTTVHFEWGPTTSYGTLGTDVSIGSGSAAVDASLPIASLVPGTVYHYRASATNGAGTVTFGDSYFVTMQPDGGTALQFDGGASYLQLPAFTASARPDEITVEFWQNVPSLRQQFQFMITPDDQSNRLSAAVPWDDGNVYWDFGNLNATGRLVYTPPADQPVTGHWEHWAFVNSAAGNYMKIYRNGIEVASKTGFGIFVPPLVPQDMILGTNFAGQLDEFRIWNRARTATEIFHDMYVRSTGTETGLLRLFHFDDGAGITAVDSSPSNVPGSLQNNPLWVASTAPIGYPVCITLPATNVGITTATLNSIVNINGHPSLVGFDLGTTTSYGQQMFIGTLGTAGDSTRSINIESLTPNTTYHYRIEGSNYAGGITYGVDQTFTTTPIYSVADAIGALQTAAGLHAATAAEAARWDVVQDASVGQVTLADAAEIARKAAGLDPNP